MPTYEYLCDRCKTKWEVVQFISDVKTPPMCCGVGTTRIWNAAPAVFNAPGFYKTDNKRR